MVCRSVPGTSVPMGLAKSATSLDDAQIQSLMHQLRHECDPNFAARAAYLVDTIDEDEGLRQRWLRTRSQLTSAVQVNRGLRPQRRDGLLRRIEAATEAPPADMQYACEHIRERALAADHNLTRALRATARLDGVHEAEARERFDQLRREAPRGRQVRATDEERRRWPGLPLDPATRYALTRLVRSTPGEDPGPPVITDQARAPVQNPQELVATVGYDADSRRMEIELSDGQRLAYRNVSARLADDVRQARRPDETWQLTVCRPEYRYPTAEIAEAYGTRRRCPTCGQFCGLEHRCLGPRGSLPGQRRNEQHELVREAAEPTPSKMTTAYLRPDDPFDDPDRPREIGLRTYDLADIAEQLRHGDDDGLLIPITAGHDQADISGYATVRLDDGHISVIAIDDVGTDDGLRCSCGRSGPDDDCVHLRDALGGLRDSLTEHYQGGAARIGEAAEDLARRHRSAAPGPGEGPPRRCSFSYQDDPELFEADVAAALARPEHERVPWRDPLVEEHLIGDGHRERRFGVELEFDIDDHALPFGEVSGDEDMQNVELVEREEEVLGHYDEDVQTRAGDWVTKVRFGYHPEVVEELQLFGDPEPTLQNTVICRVGDALHSAELISDPDQRDYHAQSRDGYPSGPLWNWSYESDSSVDGGEVVSPILSDQPLDWTTLRRACQAICAGGGAASSRTGGHVTVSAPEFGDDANRVNRLLAVTRYFQDNIEVMARAGHGRGDNYTEPIEEQPAAGYLSLRQALRRVPRHSSINIEHLWGYDSGPDDEEGNPVNDCRVEFRIWDGSLEPGRIQAQVALSVALIDYASRTADDEPFKGEPAGWSGRWPGDPHFAESTRPVREFLDLISTSDGQKRQFAALWAAGGWSR